MSKSSIEAVFLTFLLPGPVSENNQYLKLKGSEVCFGSWFQSVQYMVGWLKRMVEWCCVGKLLSIF